MNFLNLDEKDHIDKFKFFNPKESINNTQVWKKLENQEPIDYIFKNLKEFCYDVEKHHRYVIQFLFVNKIRLLHNKNYKDNYASTFFKSKRRNRKI